MAGELIIQNPWVTHFILPFLLVFTLVFAVLQKSKILGDGKKQIDAIVGLVVGLMFVAFPGPRDLVVNLMPFLAVGLVMILVLFLLWGFFYQKEFNAGDGARTAAGIVALIAVIIAVIFFSGYWQTLMNMFGSSSGGSNLLVNVLVIIVIGAVIVAVVAGGKGGDGK